MGAVLFVLKQNFDWQNNGLGSRVRDLGLLVGSGIAVYVLALLLFGIRPAQLIVEKIK
jgi:hypothetical protein